MKVNHIILIVRDLAVSKRFYQDILGFTESGAFLQHGDCELELRQFQTQGSDISDFKQISLEVEDIDEVYEQLITKALKVEKPVKGAVSRHVFLKDPDGYPIEIMEFSS